MQTISAIQWLIDNAQTTEVLSDGTVSKWFNGTLRSAQCAQIVKWMKENGKPTRVGWSYCEGDISFAVQFGKYISTQNYVKFVYTDETVPAAAFNNS